MPRSIRTRQMLAGVAGFVSSPAGGFGAALTVIAAGVFWAGFSDIAAIVVAYGINLVWITDCVERRKSAQGDGVPEKSVC